MLGTPILIDTARNGFRLTNLWNGVHFAITTESRFYQVSWTEPQSDDAWLVLDRNGNGSIDNGSELFGNFAEQAEPPPGQAKNGYSALALFDFPENGGHRDGVIDAKDAVFSQLRLWLDVNHDGMSQPAELVTLPSKNVQGIELAWVLARRRDPFGNILRYRARIFSDSHESAPGRWSYDVVLLLGRVSK